MKIAVVIPCYKVEKHILNVIQRIGPEVFKIIVVDDACPNGSGRLVSDKCLDSRVEVLTHEKNLGVGGAVKTGYARALEHDSDVVVKIDGDGQMNPEHIHSLIRPISLGLADYVKGNRFDTLESLEQMPRVRIFGNAALSFLSKISTGYWNINDPTNGLTAIHRVALSKLPLNKIQNRFFFESDVLFRLAVLRAVVFDFPMASKYGEEVSNLKIHKILVEFPKRHAVNFLKRIFYAYYLREWNIASLELPLGLILTIFGITTGFSRLWQSMYGAEAASAGSVMLSAMPIILGLQLVLAFVSYDIGAVPTRPRQVEI